MAQNSALRSPTSISIGPSSGHILPEGSRNRPVAYRHDDMPEEDHDHETQQKPPHGRLLYRVQVEFCRDIPRSRCFCGSAWVWAGSPTPRHACTACGKKGSTSARALAHGWQTECGQFQHVKSATDLKQLSRVLPNILQTNWPQEVSHQTLHRMP